MIRTFLKAILLLLPLVSSTSCSNPSVVEGLPDTAQPIEKPTLTPGPDTLIKLEGTAPLQFHSTFERKTNGSIEMLSMDKTNIVYIDPKPLLKWSDLVDMRFTVSPATYSENSFLFELTKLTSRLPGFTDRSFANLAYSIDIQLTDQQAREFEDLTEKNVEKRIAILAQGLLVSDPYVREKIPRDSAAVQITLSRGTSRKAAKTFFESLRSFKAR